MIKKAKRKPKVGDLRLTPIGQLVLGVSVALLLSVVLSVVFAVFGGLVWFLWLTYLTITLSVGSVFGIVWVADWENDWDDIEYKSVKLYVLYCTGIVGFVCYLGWKKLAAVMFEKVEVKHGDNN